jgi:putative transposase
MPRQPRTDIKDIVYHVVNRANARLQIFNEESDYCLFENTLDEGIHKFQMRVLAYSIMPNHIHLALYPNVDGQITKFMHWVTMTFTQRYHARHRTVGTGHLFQGRYKSFPFSDNSQCFQLILYIERNALRAGLVERAELWRWSSLWIRTKASKKQKVLLSDIPFEVPGNYLAIVNDNYKEILK